MVMEAIWLSIQVNYAHAIVLHFFPVVGEVSVQCEKLELLSFIRRSV